MCAAHTRVVPLAAVKVVSAFAEGRDRTGASRTLCTRSTSYDWHMPERGRQRVSVADANTLTRPNDTDRIRISPSRFARASRQGARTLPFASQIADEFDAVDIIH